MSFWIPSEVLYLKYWIRLLFYLKDMSVVPAAINLDFLLSKQYYFD